MSFASAAFASAACSARMALASRVLVSLRPSRMALSLGPLTCRTFGSRPSAFSPASVSPSRNCWRIASMSPEASPASSSDSSLSSSLPAASESSSAPLASAESSASLSLVSATSPSSDSVEDASSPPVSRAAAAARLAAKAASAGLVSAKNWCSYGRCGRCRGLVRNAGEDCRCSRCVGADAGGRLGRVLVHEVARLREKLVEPIEDVRRCVARARLELCELHLAQRRRKVNPFGRALVEPFLQAVFRLGVQPLVNLLLNPLLLREDERALL